MPQKQIWHWFMMIQSQKRKMGLNFFWRSWFFFILFLPDSRNDGLCFLGHFYRRYIIYFDPFKDFFSKIIFSGINFTILTPPKVNFGVNFYKNENAPLRLASETDRLPFLCCFYANYWCQMWQSWGETLLARLGPFFVEKIHFLGQKIYFLHH